MSPKPGTAMLLSEVEFAALLEHRGTGQTLADVLETTIDGTTFALVYQNPHREMFTLMAYRQYDTEAEEWSVAYYLAPLSYS